MGCPGDSRYPRKSHGRRGSLSEPFTSGCHACVLDKLVQTGFLPQHRRKSDASMFPDAGFCVLHSERDTARSVEACCYGKPRYPQVATRKTRAGARQSPWELTLGTEDVMGRSPKENCAGH